MLYQRGDELWLARKQSGAWAREPIAGPATRSGQHSLALTPAGEPVLALQWDSPRRLVFAWWNEGGWITETVSTTAGGSADLAVDGAGRAHLAMENSYFAPIPGGLNGFAWASEPLAERADLGGLRLDQQGVPHVVYANGVAKELRYGVRTATGTWTSEPIDTTPFRIDGRLALDAAARPHVAYAVDQLDTSSVRLAVREDGQWATEVLGLGRSPVLIEVGRDGTAHVLSWPRYWRGQPGALELEMLPPVSGLAPEQHASLTLELGSRVHIVYVDQGRLYHLAPK